MSGTEYSRPHLLRLDEAERHALAVATMADIAATSLGEAHVEWTPEQRTTHVRNLRSLLERLTD